MAKLYLRKINEGKITIDDVPLLWREKVRKEIGE
ncbi:MAG: CD1375 family protein [Clostridium sp.]